MVKALNPLLGFEAHGTLGNTLTFQKRHRGQFIRKKPTPTDPKSLAQMYHRWDYEFYSYRWHSLSDAEKLAWRKIGSRAGYTAFNAFMSRQLKDLTNLVGRWHLDEATGNIAYDTSKSGYHGTIFGATSVAGKIGLARYFDNIDDRIDCGFCPNLNFTDEDFSICFWADALYIATGVVCANLATGPGRGYALRFHFTPRIALVQYFLGGLSQVQGVPFSTTGWHHYAVIRKQPNQGKIYQDLIDITTGGATRVMSPSPLGFFIGDNPVMAGGEFPGTIDDISIFNCALNLHEIQMLYERSYPE